MNKADAAETIQGYGMQPGKNMEGAMSHIYPYFCYQENIKIDIILNKL